MPGLIGLRFGRRSMDSFGGVSGLERLESMTESIKEFSPCSEFWFLGLLMFYPTYLREQS